MDLLQNCKDNGHLIITKGLLKDAFFKKERYRKLGTRKWDPSRKRDTRNNQEGKNDLLLHVKVIIKINV